MIKKIYSEFRLKKCAKKNCAKPVNIQIHTLFVFFFSKNKAFL